MKSNHMSLWSLMLMMLLALAGCGGGSGSDDTDTGNSATTYSVTYLANNSSAGDVPVDTNAYERSQTVTVLGNTGHLERDGYTFIGWNTQADGSGSHYTQGSQFVMGDSNQALYAEWSMNSTYSVSYDGNGSAGGVVPVDSVSHEEGASVTVLGNSGGLVNPGYSFIGWNTAADGSGSDYSQGEQLIMSAGELTLYAQWSLNPTWTVIYEGNDSTGGDVPVDSASYEQGWSVTVLGNDNNLVRSGYTYAGWNTEPDGSGADYVQGSQLVMGTSDVVLYAQWSANPTYSVSYDGNGNTGGSVPIDSTHYEEGVLVAVMDNLNSLTRSGYSFAGWNSEPDGSGTGYVAGDEFVMGVVDVVLYAQWRANPRYSVTYDANNADNGSVPVDTDSYEVGQYVTVLDNTGALARSGYTFTGWNDQADGDGSSYVLGDQFVMTDSDLVLYAQWSANATYTVTYDGNGSTGGSAPVDATAYEEGVTVRVLGNSGVLVNTGYSFTGWNLSADGSGSSYAQGTQFTMRTSDVTLYAQWSANPTWAVVYIGNGNTAGDVPVDTNSYEEGSVVSVLGNLNNLARDGYSFTGWNAQADGSGADYQPGDLNAFVMGTADVVLYAQWSANPTYTVSYQGNGNTGGSVPIDSAHYEEGAMVTVLGNPNNLVRDGYSFTGWSLNADGSGTSYVQDNQFAMDTDNVVLYAKWEANPTYSVVYFGNDNDGGSVPIDTTEYEQGVSVSVLGNSGNLTRTGYTFSGWNTAADGSGDSYTQGDHFNMGASGVSLYAQWTLNPTYTVTYNGNGSDGGSVPVDTTHYEQGDTVTVFGNSGSLTLTDYAFNGWNTQADGGGNTYAQGASFIMATADVTLYAQWTYRPTYSVTYMTLNSGSGSVPVDSTRYEEGQTVTVLGNTGNLVSDNGQVFYGWKRTATGSYVYYHEGDTFSMGAANEQLTAAWAYPETITLAYDGNGNTSGSVPAPAAYNGGIWVSAAENTGNLQRTGYTFAGWFAVSCSFSGCTTYSFAPGDYFLMSSNMPGYNISENTVTLVAKWVPKATLLYNAGAFTGDFGGLAAATAICEANVHSSCGPRTKIRAFLDEGASTAETFADIPAAMGIDANLPIIGPSGDQISPNWAGLTNGIDMSLADAGVLPADTHWWSGGGVNNASNEFYSSYSVCASDAGGPWSTVVPSDLDAMDYHWGAGGSSSTTDREDWINEITTVVTPLPGGGSHTVNYRLECAESHYLLCVCGE